MSDDNLGSFWNRNKKNIGRALSVSIEVLASVLQDVAGQMGLTQNIEGQDVCWYSDEGRLIIVFCRVADPRDLDRVIEVYESVKKRGGPLTVVLVHQWTDGQGNWDAFVVSQRRVLHHVDRINGSDTVDEEGPPLRDDIYSLFACDRPFPEPGREEWATLLDGPESKVHDSFASLADKHDCSQVIKENHVIWYNPEKTPEAQFFILPDPGDLDAVIDIYGWIKSTGCPVSFVFLRSDQPRVFDIFRLSQRSYLEHHNQAKGILKARYTSEHTGGKGKVILDNLQWVPRWASLIGCLKGCLNYLGRDISDSWLFGATGHAFVLNIAHGLCPSGPTDWNTTPCLELGRNIGFTVESFDEYCPDKEYDLPVAQKQAWNFVRIAIDAGLPCYGWELRIPEYYVIYGYDEKGYYISGADTEKDKGPVSWQQLGQSEIGVVLVSSVRPTEPVDDYRTVAGALRFALDVGYNRRQWTDGYGGLEGYRAWLKFLEIGGAYRFGLGFNTAVWSESRRHAVAFLTEAESRLNAELRPLFASAVARYEEVATCLHEVSEIYPFKKGKDRRVKVDERAEKAINALRKAFQAEERGLEVLEELASRIPAYFDD